MIMILFSLKLVNDYRERNLADLINYKQTDFNSLGFTADWNNIQANNAYEWFTNDKEPADELLEFLSHYRVKKIKEKEFNRNLYKEDVFGEFEFTISHTKANPALVWVFENNVHILGKNYYKLVNGPVDIEWIKKYNDKYKEVYDE